MNGPSPSPLDLLQVAIGHQFQNTHTLRHALTHSSMTTDRTESNERLEFLGDRVLGLVIAEMLYQRFPDEAEGDLGYRFTALARAEALTRIAQEIDLGACIIMSDGERDTGGADKDGLLADACEALIAALYIDGGMPPAQAFIEKYWEPLIAENLQPTKDAKTELQEWAQARGLALPAYEVTGRKGPDHAPVFTVSAKVEGETPEQAEGANKRAAEQAAAEKLLARFGGSS